MLRVALEPRPGEPAAWQLLDARTGAVIEEGPWVAEPTESDVPVPDEDGRYRVLVSTVHPDRGWAYSRGEACRVLDLARRGGELTVTRDRTTTLRALRREGLPARLVQLTAEPWRLLVRNRALIASMVRRDWQGRYRGSLGDRVWAIANPLLLMLTYAFVFGVVLQTRFQGSSDPFVYVLYFLCGMLPWLAISEAIGRAPNVILENRNLVKKLVFPVEILPVNLAISGMCTGLMATLVYFFVLRAVQFDTPVSVFWLPVLLVPQFLLAAGVCWAWAGIGLFARDLGQINGFLLTVAFFLTPICYPEESLPAAVLPLLRKSPVYKLVAEYRLIFLGGHNPDWTVYLQLLFVGLIVFYAGFGVFRKLRPSFPDVL